jgi:hypothetical protein
MGLFGGTGAGGGGIKNRMMRKVGGMLGMPDVSGMEGLDFDEGAPPALSPGMPGSSKRKKPKKKRIKKKHRR